MRTYHVEMHYQHQGSKYPRVLERSITASSAARAPLLAFREAKRCGALKFFREANGGQVSFTVTIGAKAFVDREEEA